MKCKKCSCTDSSNFYKSNKSYCKSCIRARVKKRSIEKSEEIKEYDRNRPNKRERVQQNKDRMELLRTTSPEKWNKIQEQKRDWANKNKHKRKAHNKVANALLKGELIRPTECGLCGMCGDIEAHHDNYDKPLDVIWLCVRCHNDRHIALGTKVSN